MKESCTTPSIESRGWQLFAACRGMDSALFFPPEGASAPLRLVREARAREVCRSCSVRNACTQFALSERLEYGMWGGLTEGRRQELLRAERKRGTPEPARDARPDGGPLSPGGRSVEDAAIDDLALLVEQAAELAGTDSTELMAGISDPALAALYVSCVNNLPTAAN